MLAGMFAAFSRFTGATYPACGLVLLPFFCFNHYFVFAVPVFIAVMLLDFAANAAMMGLCVLGWRSLPANHRPTGLGRPRKVPRPQLP